MTPQLGIALQRDLSKTGPVLDARGRTLRAAAPGGAAPADAYLSVHLISCGAWPASTRDGTSSAAWWAGACTAELKALGPDGRPLATIQRTGRWDSPRRERLDGNRMLAEAVSRAVDATAERLAHDLRPAPSKVPSRPATGRGPRAPARGPRSAQTLAGTSASMPRASAAIASCSIAKTWCEPGAGLAEGRRPA